MNETGIITKQLLGRTTRIDEPPNNNKIPSSEDDNLITSDFGDMTNIQLPYQLPPQQQQQQQFINIYNDDDDDKLYFCDYVIYFAIIILFFGYIGYYIVNKKIISYDTVTGINLGITFGLIMIHLLWSSMK